LRLNKDEIEQSGDLDMLALLYKSLNESDKYAEVMKKTYKGMAIARITKSSKLK
jgi:hypothetical protein